MSFAHAREGNERAATGALGVSSLSLPPFGMPVTLLAAFFKRRAVIYYYYYRAAGKCTIPCSLAHFGCEVSGVRHRGVFRPEML